MHNRLRMVTAMFLSKNLLIDWREGERWFMRHLIDGDLAANNGGWQWSASTGTDSVLYFRLFNPISQSQRFDPDGQFLRRWLPELQGLGKREIHNPSTQRSLFGKADYPAPIIDLGESRARAQTPSATCRTSGHEQLPIASRPSSPVWMPTSWSAWASSTAMTCISPTRCTRWSA